MKSIPAAVLAAALLASACNDPVPPARPSPVAPTVTDTFTGTLTTRGTNSHPFVVNEVGGVKATLTSVDPLTKLAISVGAPSPTSGTSAGLGGRTTDTRT